MSFTNEANESNFQETVGNVRAECRRSASMTTGISWPTDGANELVILAVIHKRDRVRLGPYTHTTQVVRYFTKIT